MEFIRKLDQILDEIRTVLGRLDMACVEPLADALVAADQVFVFGQGRTGHVTRAFAVRLMHLGMRVHFVGDTTTPPISDRDLCLVNSGTGDTRFAYHVAMAAKEAGAKLATVTAHPEARIGKQADIVLRIPAPTKGERFGPAASTQPAGSLFEQALMMVLEGLVLVLMERLGHTSQSLLQRHANIE